MAEVRPDAVIHLAGIPTESVAARRSDLARRHDRSHARGDAAPRRTPHRLRLQQPRRGAHPTRRPGTRASLPTCAAAPTPTTAWARSPPRPCCSCTSTATASTRSAPGSARSGPARPRVGSCPPGSHHDDAVRMFDAALTAPSPGFAVIYGISANTRAWWDLGPGRALGYDPQDDAEAFADGRRVRAGERRGPGRGRPRGRPLRHHRLRASGLRLTRSCFRRADTSGWQEYAERAVLVTPANRNRPLGAIGPTMSARSAYYLLAGNVSRMSQLVTHTVADGIAHVRLARPEKLNALTLQTLDELVATARALRKDRTLRVVIISGEGASFCAGLDFGSVMKKPAGIVGAFLPSPVARDQRVPGGVLGLAATAGSGHRRGARSLLRRRSADRAGGRLPDRHPRLGVVGARGPLGASSRT